MNYRKINSQGYIPFSWEEKPGIPKFINNHKSKSKSISHVLMGFEFENLNITSEENERSSGAVRAQLTSIAPPPAAPSRKGCPQKDLRRQNDPFLAALKSCTKEKKNLIKSSFFSCKKSCNIENDNLVKFSKLPPIPKERYYNKSFVWNSR